MTILVAYTPDEYGRAASDYGTPVGKLLLDARCPVVAVKPLPVPTWSLPGSIHYCNGQPGGLLVVSRPRSRSRRSRDRHC